MTTKIGNIGNIDHNGNLLKIKQLGNIGEKGVEAS